MLISKLFFGVLFIFSGTAWGVNPLSFTYQGQLLTTSGSPSTDTVNITMQILSPGGSCVLYEQQVTGQNFAASNGYFTIQVGSAVGSPQRDANDPALSMLQVFNNQPVALMPSGSSNCAAGYTPSSADTRLLRVAITGPSGTTDVLSPDQVISSSPFALSAETLQGLTPADLLSVNNTGSTVLTQANLNNIFSSTNFPILQGLLSGTSSQFLPANPTAPVNFNGQVLSGIANPSAAQDAASKNYVDSTLGGSTMNLSGIGLGIGGGKTLIWDQVANQWVAQTVAGLVSTVASGTGLLGGPITNNGTLSVDVGVTANKILQLNSSAKLPAVDGSLLTNINVTALQSRSVSAVAPANGQVLAWNNSMSQWLPTTNTGGGMTALTGDVTASGSGSVATTISANAISSAKINNSGIAVNRLLMTDATTGSTIGYSTCALNQVLQWTATGWACTNVSAVLGASGVTAAAYGSSTQIPQLTVNAQGLVTALNNVNIAFPITSVAGRTGAVTLGAADIGGLGTAAVQNFGTTAGQLVQLNGSAQLPAVDGSLLSNVNATKLQGVSVAATAPTNGQVLAWNSTSSQWQPTAVSTAAGSFLNGGNSFGANSSIGNQDNYSLNLLANNLIAVTITPSGNVGIGTSAPAYTLDVTGTANITGSLNVTGMLTAPNLTSSGNLYASTVTTTGTSMMIGAAANSNTTLGSTGSGATDIVSGTGGLNINTGGTGAISIGDSSTGAASFGNTGANAVSTFSGGSGTTGSAVLYSAGTGASAVSLNATNGGVSILGNPINIGSSGGSSTLTVGNSSGTGTSMLTLGQETGTSTGTTSVTLGGIGAVPNTGTSTVNIGTNSSSSAGSVTTNIGMATTAGSTTTTIGGGGGSGITTVNVNMSTTSSTPITNVGNVSSTGASTVNIGNSTGSGTPTVKIGSNSDAGAGLTAVTIGGVMAVANTGASTVNIGNNASTSSASVTTTIGQNSSASPATALLTIGGTTAVANTGTNTINIGGNASTAANSVMTTIGQLTNTSSGTTSVTIGGKSGAGTGASTLNLGVNNGTATGLTAINIGTGTNANGALTLTMGSASNGSNATVITSGSSGKVTIGSGGVAFTAMGTCLVASTAWTTTVTTGNTCSGVTTTSYVTCSGATAVTGQTFSVSATAANTVSVVSSASGTSALNCIFITP